MPPVTSNAAAPYTEIVIAQPKLSAAQGAERIVGRYSIVREVGRGGMAVVYLARQRALNRPVALKELLDVGGGDPALAERFVRESRLSGSFAHPNIVTVFDYFEHEGSPFIAMEYLERGSMRQHVRRLSVPQIAGVLEDLLGGLAEAELRGVVHRDLKPENLLLTAEGRVKIADFGIAKALERPGGGTALTETGVVIGTPSYMAPEQALGGPLGPRTDLYATGVIAYELLTGRVPFGPPDPPIAILCKHVNEQVPPLRRPDLHPDLLAWLERMLAKEPRRRPAGAREAWEQLEDVVLAVYGARWRRRARLTPPASARPSLRVATPVPESPATPVPESPPPELPAPEPPSEPRRAERRHGWRIGLAGATGLAAVLAAAFVVVAHRAPAPVPVRLPALTGMSEADAVDAIQALGLRIDARHVRRTASIETARGLVFEQRPLPGARLRDGTFVTLVVSAGKPRVRVPDVRGRKLKAAGRALRRAHLRTTTIRLHSRRPIGTVLAQSTRPGRRARWGSKVTLRVSIGPPLVVVPQLYGLSSEAAAARLQAASLHVVRVDIDSSEPAGIVVGQATPGCRKLVRGRAVTVYVSRGPRVVVVHGNGVSGNGGSDRRTTRTHRKPKQIWEGG